MSEFRLPGPTSRKDIETSRRQEDLITEVFGKGRREVLNCVLLDDFNHEFPFFSNHQSTVFFNYCCHIRGFHRSPAARTHQQLPAFQIFGGYQVYGAKPSFPPDLCRRLKDRGDRIVVYTAPAKQTQSDHRKTSSRSISISSSFGRASKGTLIPSETMVRAKQWT